MPHLSVKRVNIDGEPFADAIVPFNKRSANFRQDKAEADARCLERAALIKAAPDLLAALEALIDDCPDCGGTGTVYMLMDETEIGQAPGSSARDCRRCKSARHAAAKAKGIKE